MLYLEADSSATTFLGCWNTHAESHIVLINVKPFAYIVGSAVMSQLKIFSYLDSQISSFNLCVCDPIVCNTIQYFGVTFNSNSPDFYTSSMAWRVSVIILW